MNSMMKTCILPDRGIISVSGPDKDTFLQNIITQDITKVEEYSLSYGALLTPQGKIVSDFLIGHCNDSYYLDCHISSVESLLKRLNLYKLRANVEIKDYSDKVEVEVAWDAVVPPPPLWSYDPRTPCLGMRSYWPDSDIFGQILANTKICSIESYYAHVIACGVPMMGYDFGSEDSFPLDMNMDALNGVDYKKGCFVGQEVASRMKRKGEIRKRIWRVDYTGEPLPVGTALKVGDTTVGSITSSTDNMSLALIRLDRLQKVENPTEVTAGELTVTLKKPDYLGDESQW
ncbi:MAG: CAF17-like 4Fe-4S cluster assembly/insertion protein YgfZ [bacterium]